MLSWSKKVNKRHICVLLVALLLLPTNIFCVLDKTGLDGSWRYLINAASSLDLTFGKEIIYTYGPLGFICYALNMDYNFLITGIVFCFLYLFLVIYCAKFIFDEKTEEKQIGILFLLLFFALYILRDYTQFAQQKENYIMFVILFVFTNIFFGVDRRFNLVINTLLIVLCFFVKFTLVLTMIPAEIFLVLYFFGKKTERKWAIGMLGSVVAGLGLSVFGYFLYNPSVKGLVRYIVGAKEISAGYTAAMQLVENTYTHAILPFLLLLVIGIGSVFMLLKKKGLGWYFLMLDSMLFLAFKHAFVRGLDYTYYSFFFACCVCVLIYWQSIGTTFVGLQTKSNGWCMRAAKVLAGTILVAVVLNGLTYTKTLEEICAIVKSNIAEAKGASEIIIPMEFTSEIPDDIVTYIGNASVSIYPNNIIDGYIDKLNVKHYPTYQNYCAYTPYLDKLNAQFFVCEEAPEFVLIKYDAKGLDGRVFYIDTPATYEAIIENYEFIKQNEKWILLKKNRNHQKEKQPQMESVEILQEQAEDALVIQNLTGAEKLYIHMDHNLAGTMLNLFFGVPTVYIRFHMNDGTMVEGRVIPDNLRNGISLKNIPTSRENSVNIFKGEHQSEVDFIEIYGNGMKYYNIKCTASR